MIKRETRRRASVLIPLIVFTLVLPSLAVQEQQKEYVQVLNVEMILRVLKDGAPVGGLKKSDFALYEDGKECEINGFFENHRRMAQAAETNGQPPRPRLYLLFFWVGNPAADVAGVLNRFFSSVYREGDRVILGTPLRTFDLVSPRELAVKTAAFLEQWQQEAKDRLARRLQFHGDLNRLLEDLVQRLYEDIAAAVARERRARALGLENPALNQEEDTKEKEIQAFIRQYERTIQEYRLRELSPDPSAFEAMARSLLPGQNDKFALVFFQHDSLPLFHIDNVRALCVTKQIPENIISELADAMSKIEEQARSRFDVRVLSERLKSLFIQANTQFHLLSLSPYQVDEIANASNFFSLTRNEEVFSNWDQIMQDISKNTGGLRVDGDRMLGALDQVASFEDIYYHITYVPRGEGARRREIDVRVNLPGAQVIFGRALEMSALPLVKIADVSATRQFIRLGVVDYYAISKDGAPTGFVEVQVTGRQADDEPPQLLLSQTSETTGPIELPLAFPQPGRWDLEVRVTDQVTGRQDVKKTRLEIAAAVAAHLPVGSQSALAAVLARAAAYAEKLKTAAFHFVCRESVAQVVFPPGGVQESPPAAERNDWVYDYQIIARDRQITESRVLLEKNREKLHSPKAQLETVFQSYFSFYMPVTLVAREKQRLYRYRLLAIEKSAGQNVWHVAAARRSPKSIPWGELWIGEEDGSVSKIQIDQTSIVGFENLAQKAVEKGLLPAITTIHEYGLTRDGMRFPSKTTFIESYQSYEASAHHPRAAAAGQRSAFERSRTYFEYKDHLFFSVSTHVKEKVE